MTNRQTLTGAETTRIYRALKPFYVRLSPGSCPRLEGELLSLCGTIELAGQKQDVIVLDRKSNTHYVDPRDLVSTGIAIPPLPTALP